MVILKAAAGELIQLYGDGQNVRDRLNVADHVNALLLTATQGTLGRAYFVGGHEERTNKQVLEAICADLDQLVPEDAPRSHLITLVKNRPGHECRSAIDPTRIKDEPGWQPRHSFETGLAAKVRLSLEHKGWCSQVRDWGR
ncbi:GDP-mannose 4,6-dehydratase [Cyanobium sp. ATX 6F1]|uniref:GDP-mannose 4,6-dehydratase n=1 Tax=unclassified Cyanobium TaxID=2627006 RepID=UPI0028F3E68A|nr:GDP-mannose 4,6-dehydratase [Cyanobium sp. ATX 6F1]